MGEFVKSCLNDSIASEDTRVFQAVTPSGVIIGEFFSFHGQEDMAEWKEETLLFYPGARVEPLKDSNKAIGVQTWVAKYTPYQSWRKPEQLPSSEIIEYIQERRQEWFVRSKLSTQLDMEICCELLHLQFVGSLRDYRPVPGSIIDSICNQLARAGCIDKN